MHAVFQRSGFLEGLSDAIKSNIYWLGAVRKVEAGEVLIEEGAENNATYLLLEGELKISRPDRPDRLTGLTLGYRGPGDLIGEYSLLDGLPAAATVTVEKAGSVYWIEHAVLRELLASSPEIGAIVYRNMLGYLVGRLRAQDEELDIFVS